MAAIKKGLGSKGKGLEALINTKMIENNDGILEIDINKIETNKQNTKLLYGIPVQNKALWECIKTLQRKHILESDLTLQKAENCFYGRDEEILNFKKTFDSREGIKVLVASGITGIGRKSYLLQCLKQTFFIKNGRR